MFDTAFGKVGMMVCYDGFFPEVARELTVKAAALAGLPRVVLIEEPQAAFYAWIYAHSADWDQLVHPGQKILVCDIGGGTSDFTLIRVRRGQGGNRGLGTCDEQDEHERGGSKASVEQGFVGL